MPMDTTEEPSKLPSSSLLDSITSSQPLLASTSETQSQFLQISYNYGPRPFKDIPFLLLFCLFVLATFGFGIFASVHRNHHHSQVSSFIYNSTSSSCTLFQESAISTRPVWVNSSKSGLLETLIWVLAITFILSVPAVLFVLFMLKNYTKQIVYISLPFFIIVPIAINVYWFVACTVSSSCSDVFPLGYRILVLVFIFLIIGVIAWIFVVNWHRIELTVKIIRVASSGLSQNLGLLWVLPGLILGLLVYYVPIVLFIVFSRFNGKIVPREKHGEYDCVWKEDNWVPGYMALAILTMIWSATSMIEAQVFVISGTIAQWYFSKEYGRPKRSLRGSLRNAFGSSSGTICLSGLLIAIVRMVRAIVDNAREDEAPGIVNLIMRCCVNAFMSAFDFLNRFTINFAAITGEAYCTSAKMTYELLKRNLLSAAFVETVSTRLLAGIIFVLSTIYAILVCIILKAIAHLGTDAYFVGVMAWVLMLVVLSHFVHVLDNVIETVYVCYAIDRDRGEVCKQEVHEVYVHLPISRNQRLAFGSRTPQLV